MTRAEVLAFNAGIATVADLAARSAAAIRSREIAKPTRYPFASEALQAVADEAAGLALSPNGPGPESSHHLPAQNPVEKQ